MEAKKSNKIRDIVRLQQLLKKWKKIANSSKKTLSLTENSVPKGCLAVCVGKEQKRFVIPMDHLGHQAFQALLRETEEVFGFNQTGVLRIPCEVSMFESILKIVELNKDLPIFLPECRFNADDSMWCYSSVGSPMSQSRSPLCM